jgi:signal transduction histidine kinase
MVAGAAIWSAGLLAAALAIGFVVAAHFPGHLLLVHNGLLIVTAAVLVTAGISVIRRGLSPFALLRERLAAVREGRSARLEGEYPSEVAPLVDDLNRLLDERERRIARAMARAGDLAHGLKTPLAILVQEIDRAEAAGQPALAAALRAQVDRMRRQIETHLAQARVAAAAAAASVAALDDVVAGLIRTMQRLYGDRGLTLAAHVPSGLRVRVPAEDVEEMLGNLLDNACKWARTQVSVSAAVDAATIVVDVDDDGVGIEPAMRERVIGRGVRADETAPGSGLGLAIVRDLAEAYGGSIVLDRSPGGGVRARLRLPGQAGSRPGD